MFKLAQSPTFWATVEVEFAAEKGGIETNRFDVKFKRLGLDELRELHKRLSDLEDPAVLHEIMVGWRGIEGKDGAEAEFNEENLGELLNMGVGPAIVGTFFRNIPRAKQKN